MHVVLKRIQYEVLFAAVVLMAIPIFLVVTYWNATLNMLNRAPALIEKIVRKYVYED